MKWTLIYLHLVRKELLYVVLEVAKAAAFIKKAAAFPVCPVQFERKIHGIGSQGGIDR